MDEAAVDKLRRAAKQMRKDCLVMALAAGNAGAHLGGSLSMIEIAAALYLEVMKTGPDWFRDERRDRFILSKGHGVPAVYAALRQLGVIGEAELRTFKGPETRLYGHPSMNPDFGFEFSSGSLGQGLALGVGSALALRRRGNHASRVFVLIGDGECDEGSIWEAAACASHYKLGQLIAIIDKNHLQYDGDTAQILSMDPLPEKWLSFGWEVEQIDGHDVEACCAAFSRQTERPHAVIADTVKGKGISFMENVAAWHHSRLSQAQFEQALQELG